MTNRERSGLSLPLALGVLVVGVAIGAAGFYYLAPSLGLRVTGPAASPSAPPAPSTTAPAATVEESSPQPPPETVPAQEASAAPAASGAAAAPPPRRQAATPTGPRRVAGDRTGAAPPPEKAASRERPAAAGTPPPPAPPATTRAFVPGLTRAESTKGPGKGISGFETQKSEDVKVKRAAEVPGHVTFSVIPEKVTPGEKYIVRVSLANGGKKPIGVQQVVVTTSLNDKPTTAAVKPLASTVPVHQSAVVYEVAGTWDRRTTSWRMHVDVTSNHLDVYHNDLVWK
jgi:hypothetical protein